MYEISSSCFTQLKILEGLRLLPYKDQGGRWTIGFGHLMTPIEIVKHIFWPSITQEEATQLLINDTIPRESYLNSIIKVPVTQGQFDAVFCIMFNVGNQAIATSTLLKKLNARDYKGAALEFRRWVFVNGKISAGLVERRSKEEQMFNGK